MHQKPLSCPWPCPLALITVVKTKGRSWASRFEYTADQIFGEKISECQEVKRLKVAGPELHFGLLLSMLQKKKKGNHKEIKFNQISQKVRRWGWNIYPSHLTLPGINLIKFHRLGGKIVNNPPIILLLSHNEKFPEKIADWNYEEFDIISLESGSLHMWSRLFYNWLVTFSLPCWHRSCNIRLIVTTAEAWIKTALKV